jgi:hypothetical protein
MKKLIAALLVALMSLTMAAVLVGCDGGDSSDGAGGAKTSSDITSIQVFKQNAGGIDISNYQVVYKQTPDEWNALSDDAREKLVTEGYDQALAQIQMDQVSNYNITGNTALGADEKSQLTFMLDHENLSLLIFGADGQTAELPLDR